MAVRTTTLIDAATALGAGRKRAAKKGRRSFQAVGSTSAGAGTADVKVQGSNDGVNWLDIATISLVLGVTEVSDGQTYDNTWGFIRGNVTTLTGTNAAVSLFMGD